MKTILEVPAYWISILDEHYMKIIWNLLKTPVFGVYPRTMKAASLHVCPDFAFKK